MRRITFLLLAGSLALVACGGDSGDTDAATPDVTEESADDLGGTDQQQPIPAFTVVNFNAGLAAGYVDYAPERLPLLGPALSALQADVVCLEEVWTDADAAALIAATQAVFPHSYREATSDGGGSAEPACTVDEIGPLQTCALANCAEVAAENLATCVLGKCGPEFQSVSDACQGCLASQIGKPLADMVANCTTSSGGKYAYEGRNGVLLLSKHPLASTEFLQFESYVNARVVLHARVEAPGLTPDVFCTHLTADLSADLEYAGTYGSWGEEQGAQIDQMLTWIGEKAASVDGPVVLAGDLNCGPAFLPDGITGEHVENYDKLTDADWADPFAEATGVVCSWCGDNPLVGGGDSTILDHVLVKGTGFTSSAARVLDQPVEIQSGGAAVQTRLSDHYGVSVTVVFPAL